MPERARIAIIVVLAALIAWAGYAYWGNSQARDSNEIEASGTIEATEVTVSSQMAGRIKEVAADEGESVKRGRLLVEIDDGLLRDQVRTAHAGVSIAKAAVDAVSDGTDAEKRSASAQLRQARLNLDMARLQLKYAQVRSPVDGVVLSRGVEVGENVIPGSALMVIGRLDAVDLVVYLPEPLLPRIRLGQSTIVRTDAPGGETFDGKVTLISQQPEFTPTSVQTKDQRVTTVYAVTVKIDNADHRLKPGMPADATFQVAQ